MSRKTLSCVVEFSLIHHGLLKIVIPRSLLDSKNESKDLPFFVLVDGEEVEFRIDTTSLAHAFLIPILSKNKQVEIIGTEVEGIAYFGKAKQENIVEISSGADNPKNKEFFKPSILEINMNDKVKWKNCDKVSHTITSEDSESGSNSLFDSSLINPQSTFEVTFTQAGTYDYFCMVHPWMKGKIIVKS